ncbi:MAG: site-specific integrase [Firmicutes bacterium]|nr:site-specific integrase [Bacillota bacterium]
MPIYKDEKRGTWFVSCYYVDWEGKRKLKKKRGFERRKDAVKFEREFLEKQGRTSNITFGLLVEAYTEDMSDRLRETTQQTKFTLTQKHILPFFGNLILEEITPIHIRKWQARLLAKKYAKTYTKTINSQLVAIFNYAVKFYGLSENPCQKAGNIGSKNADSMDFFTHDEFNKFLEYVEDVPAKVGFELLFYTGVRIGELLALTASDFDFDSKTLKITKNYQVVKGKGKIFEPKTKKSTREIPLPPSVATTVQNYIANLQLYWQVDERIFPCSHVYFTYAKDKAIKASGLKHIRLHDFRHSHASLLIELGLPIVAISERLGHDNISTTLNTYSHLYPNTRMEAANLIENLIQNRDK